MSIENPAITTIKGAGIPLRANDIDTDRIIPARYLRCITFDGLGEHAFEDDREQDASHVFNQEIYKDASILVTGRNFGCGSSREHAPQSLRKWGINGIVAESFAEIFFGNCVAIGIPCFTASREDLETLWSAIEAKPATELVMDVEHATIKLGKTTIQGQMPEDARESLTSGTWNATALLLQADERIDTTARRLPYIGQFNVAVGPQIA